MSELAYRLESNKQLITDVGGVDVILLAMADNRTSGRVQLEGCRALFSLAIRPLSKSRIVALNGVGTIVRGMMDQPQNSHVQDHACRLLSEIMYNNSTHVQMVVDAGGVDVILEGMIEHSLLQHQGEEKQLTPLEDVSKTKSNETQEKGDGGGGCGGGGGSGSGATATTKTTKAPAGSSASVSINVEDRGHKALKNFDRRTLFESLCALFSTVRPNETLRLLRVLRLFIVVKMATGETVKTTPTNSAGHNMVDPDSEESCAAAEAAASLIENDEIRSRILFIARDHRSRNPEIWTRDVAKSFGVVLKMFKDGLVTSPPPSPTRPMVRNFTIPR